MIRLTLGAGSIPKSRSCQKVVKNANIYQIIVPAFPPPSSMLSSSRSSENTLIFSSKLNKFSLDCHFPTLNLVSMLHLIYLTFLIAKFQWKTQYRTMTNTNMWSWNDNWDFQHERKLTDIFPVFTLFATRYFRAIFELFWIPGPLPAYLQQSQ